MIIQANSSDTLQLITGSSVNTITVHVSYVNYVSPSTYTPGRFNTSITGTATTTILAGPASGINTIKTITVNNSSATSNLITIQIIDSTESVTALLFVYTLLVNETIVYTDEQGFIVMDGSGGRKETPLAGRYLSLTTHTSGTTHTTGVSTNTVKVTLVGGGGGGAGVAGNAANQAYGSGGAAGGTTIFTAAVTPNTGYSYTVGGGGAGGTNNANGANGSNTNFTVSGSKIYTAQGGANGQNMANGATVVIGVGGIATPANTANSPQISIGGAAGGNANRINGTSGQSGMGGISEWGPGGAPIIQGAATAGTAGIAGGNYGGGGSGAGGNSNANGGAGASGAVIVEEYS